MFIQLIVSVKSVFIIYCYYYLIINEEETSLQRGEMTVFRLSQLVCMNINKYLEVPCLRAL